MVGGGSGGHITPLLAIARELRKSHKEIRLVYVGERAGQFGDIAQSSGLFDECHFVFAGKLRRYYGESLLRQIFDIKTIVLNVRDIGYLLIGSIQSVLLLHRLQADTVFLKGGFVCVPLAFACRFHRVPCVTHDSDATPGLSNRLAARYARIHAVAMPARYYDYLAQTIRVVGVPINPQFPTHKTATQSLKKEYGVRGNHPILLLTGGSQGSRRLNSALIAALPKLVKKHPKIHIFHHVGMGNEAQYDAVEPRLKKHVTCFDFSDVLYKMSALSDIVITRAGATTLAEFSAQAKACIIIPHPELAGDHQTKNAAVYEDSNAALVLNERDVLRDESILPTAINNLVVDASLRKRFGENAQKLAPSIPAARSLAKILTDIAGDTPA